MMISAIKQLVIDKMVKESSIFGNVYRRYVVRFRDPQTAEARSQITKDDAEHRQVKAITLEELMIEFGNDGVDLLTSTVTDVSMTSYFHYQTNTSAGLGKSYSNGTGLTASAPRLERVSEKLRSDGYRLVRDGQIVYALPTWAPKSRNVRHCRRGRPVTV